MTTPSAVISPIRAARRQRRLSQAQVANHLRISEKTYWRFENGHGLLTIEQLGQLAELLHLPGSMLGLTDTDDSPPVHGDDLLRMVWGLFFAGATDALQPQLIPLLSYLEARHTRPNLLIARGYQAAVTLLRDRGDLATAQIIADRMVDVARAINSVDELAAAFMRRSRVPIDAIQYTTDPAAIGTLLKRATDDAHAAAVLAPRCRPVLHGVILLNQGEIDARYGMPREATVALNAAFSLSDKHAGTDDLGLILHPAGALHMRARAGLMGAIPLRDAKSDIISAIELLPARQNRWRVDMNVTLTAILVALGDSDGALRTADALTSDIRSMHSRRIADRLKKVLAVLPETKEIRMIQRALRWKD